MSFVAFCPSGHYLDLPRDRFTALRVPKRLCPVCMKMERPDPAAGWPTAKPHVRLNGRTLVALTVLRGGHLGSADFRSTADPTGATLFYRGNLLGYPVLVTETVEDGVHFYDRHAKRRTAAFDTEDIVSSAGAKEEARRWTELLGIAIEERRN